MFYFDIFCLCEVVEITLITTTQFINFCCCCLPFALRNGIKNTTNKIKLVFSLHETISLYLKKDLTSGNLEFLKGIRQFISFLTFFTLFVESNYIAF